MQLSKNISETATSLKPYGVSVFTKITDLSNRHGAVNLSQGFPDFDGPLAIREAAASAIINGPNQYAPAIGMQALRQSVAEKMQRFYNISVCQNTEVTVTAGATEGLASVLLGLVNPGDEVILLDPSYDLYPAIISRAGGIPVHLRIEPPNFDLPQEALTRAFSLRTRAIIVNNPQNPCGKVYSKNELSFIADLCCKFDAVAIADEVYEHLVYDNASHRTLLSIEGLRDRAAVVSSTAKTFSMTGWKVGFVIASPAITEAVRAAHQFLTFCTPPAFQLAMASAISSDNSYYENLKAAYTDRRNKLSSALDELGFRVISPKGTYFLNVLIDKEEFGDDLSFCEHLITEVGVAAVPVSFFYEGRTFGTDMVRFCFCKKDETLNLAIDRLRAWRSKPPRP
jgi:aspartate/methionine/tyrosine aminotransferase